jgi:hypothetical protein
MEQTDGLFDAADDAVAYPLDSFLGFETNGTTTNLLMNFKGVRDSNGNAITADVATLTITANKQKETILEITQAINRDRDGFVIVADGSNGGVFASQYITAVSLALVAGGV